jgi:hypothetical protein
MGGLRRGVSVALANGVAVSGKDAWGKRGANAKRHPGTKAGVWQQLA